MKKWKGWVIRKEYFLIHVEADTWEEAREKMWDVEVEDEPVDIDWEIYDVEEDEQPVSTNLIKQLGESNE
jgi:hypothetical protein